MKKSTNPLVLALILFSISLIASSQDYVKYNQVDESFFSIDKCPIDSAAQAFFIFNEQTCMFNYYKTTVNYNANGMLTDGADYRNDIHIHRAIKILDDNASDWGDFTYRYSVKRERIESIRGVTYNLENGKVVKTKLDRKQIQYEEVSTGVEALKISMPNVKKGSVIELEINISSQNFYSSGPWQMQYTIPVLKSILVFKRPEYYIYNKIFKGYYPIQANYKEQPMDVQLVVKVDGQASDRNQNNVIRYTEYTEEFIVNNLPAFPIEPYLSTPFNYLSSLKFELSFAKFPNQPEQHFNSSWEALAKQLLDDDDFGKQLSGTGFLKDIATDLKSKASDNDELVKLCYEYVRDNITCDNNIGIFCDKSIKNVLKDKAGDVPGMNLLLTALLREAGIKAYPVILSTRRNGVIQPIYPSIDDFNYVICLAEPGNSSILMDASDKYLTPDLLDPICLNDKGRIIDQSRTGWIELSNPRNSYKRTAIWKVSLTDDGTAEAKLEETFEDIAAYSQRDRIRDNGSFEKLAEKLNKPDEGQSLTASSVENESDISLPLVQKIDLTLNKGYQNENLIIFQPLFNEVTSDNPFKINKREYPVEFEYPINEKVTVVTEIPEGYEVESLPKPVTFNTFKGELAYVYNVRSEGNTITAEYEFVRKRMVFTPDVYNDLKEFYRKVVESQNESVVLISVSE